MFIYYSSCFQVILLEEAWSELFLLCAIQWSMPLDSCPLIAGLYEQSQASNTPILPSMVAELQILQEVVARFRTIRVDPAEFACLKAVVLFKSGKWETVVRMVYRLCVGGAGKVTVYKKCMVKRKERPSITMALL